MTSLSGPFLELESEHLNIIDIVYLMFCPCPNMTSKMNHATKTRLYYEHIGIASSFKDTNLINYSIVLIVTKYLILTKIMIGS